MTFPSPAIETNVSPFSALSTQVISQITSVCFPSSSLESHRGVFSFHFTSYIDMLPYESPTAIKLGLRFENWQHVMQLSVNMIFSGK